MELFFESRPEIQSTTGKMQFFQRQPQIHPEPVLGPSSFVDGGGTSLYGAVLNEGGRLRMWYQAWPRDWNGMNVDLVGYAESDDGIEWEKPTLGLVDYGGTDNNLVDLKGHPPSLFVDPGSPASHRYRATVCTGPSHQGADAELTKYGYYTAHSADGISWEYDQDFPWWDSADAITCAYNPVQRRGIAAIKYIHRFQGTYRRLIYNAEFRDGQWSDAHMALVPDDYDNIRAMTTGFASADYYGMGMMAAGTGMVGFIWQFRHSLPRTADSGIGVFGAVDVTLAYQNGPGDCWLHMPGRPDFISHSDPPWGHGGVYTACSPVEVGDEHRLYFSSSAHTHGWYVNEQWRVVEELKQTLIDGGICRVGFARWPKWRLFGFQSDPHGTLSLNIRPDSPCTFLLNYECEVGGSIRAELPGVDGCSLDDSVELTGDSLGSPIAWHNGTAIPPAEDGAPRTVKLHLDRATVYAYEVAPV